MLDFDDAQRPTIALRRPDTTQDPAAVLTLPLLYGEHVVVTRSGYAYITNHRDGGEVSHDYYSVDQLADHVDRLTAALAMVRVQRRSIGLD